MLMRRCQTLKHWIYIQSGLAGLEKWPETKVEKEQVQASSPGRKFTAQKSKARQIAGGMSQQHLHTGCPCAQMMLSVTATGAHIWISCRENGFAGENGFAVKSPNPSQTFLVANGKPPEGSRFGLEWGLWPKVKNKTIGPMCPLWWGGGWIVKDINKALVYPGLGLHFNSFMIKIYGLSFSRFDVKVEIIVFIFQGCCED